jgi:hypothetical protein
MHFCTSEKSPTAFSKSAIVSPVLKIYRNIEELGVDLFGLLQKTILVLQQLLVSCTLLADFPRTGGEH